MSSSTVLNTTRGASSSSSSSYRGKMMLVSDARNVHAYHARSTENALSYVAVILACYLVGMLILLLHHVRQKYGQITLYDIFYELAPSSLVGGGGSSNSAESPQQENMSPHHPATTHTARGAVAGVGNVRDDEGVVDEELEDQRLLEQGRRKRRPRRQNSLLGDERQSIFSCFHLSRINRQPHRNSFIEEGEGGERSKSANRAARIALNRTITTTTGTTTVNSPPVSPTEEKDEKNLRETAL